VEDHVRNKISWTWRQTCLTSWLLITQSYVFDGGCHAKLSHSPYCTKFVDYRSWIINLLLDVLVCSIAVYFYLLFTYTTSSHQHDCISATSLNNNIKHLACLVSLDPQDFSGQSLHHGGATIAFQCGIPSELIKVQGDWKSDAYMLYLTLSLADRLVLSHVMSQQIQSF